MRTSVPVTVVRRLPERVSIAVNPVSTVCTRPLSRRSILVASCSSAGFPRTVPSSVTTVSAPSTIAFSASGATASAFEADSRLTNAAGVSPGSGGPSSDSGLTTVTGASNALTSRLLRGESEARTIGTVSGVWMRMSPASVVFYTTDPTTSSPGGED